MSPRRAGFGARRGVGALRAGLCVALVAGVLAACGSDDDGGDGGDGQAGGGDQSAQLAAGEQSYADNCARCHGAELEGGTGPNLTGPDRPLENYETAAGLFDYVSKTMPFDEPGSLSEQQYYDAIAYVIEANGSLPADTVLNKQTAAGVRLTGGN